MNRNPKSIEHALAAALKAQPQLALTDPHWLKAHLLDTVSPSQPLSVVLAAAELGIPKRLSASRQNPEFAASQAVMCLERDRGIQAAAARGAVAIWAAALNMPLAVKPPQASTPPTDKPVLSRASHPAPHTSAVSTSAQQPPRSTLRRRVRLTAAISVLVLLAIEVFTDPRTPWSRASSATELASMRRDEAHRWAKQLDAANAAWHETRQQLAILEKDRNHVAHELDVMKHKATAAELPVKKIQELQMALDRAMAERDAITSERDHAMERADDLQAMLDRTLPKLQEYEDRETAAPRIATYSNGRAEGKITKLTEEDHHMFEARLNTSPAVESYEVSTTAWPEGSLGMVYAEGQRVGSFRVYKSRHNLIVGRTIENCDLRLGDEVHVSPQ